MNNLGSFTVMDWFLMGQIAVIWLYIAVKAGEWGTMNIINLAMGRNRKRKVEAAITQIFAVYELAKGESLHLETADGWCLDITQREGKAHDTKR